MVVKSRIKRLSDSAILRDRHDTGETVAVEGNDVEFDGILEVTGSDQFNNKVFNGLGRQKSYGYGMLLLYPELQYYY